MRVEGVEKNLERLGKVLNFTGFSRAVGTMLADTLRRKTKVAASGALPMRAGDGILRGIAFSMDIARQPGPKGGRVNVVLSGKFLPYKVY